MLWENVSSFSRKSGTLSKLGCFWDGRNEMNQLYELKILVSVSDDFKFVFKNKSFLSRLYSKQLKKTEENAEKIDGNTLVNPWTPSFYILFSITYFMLKDLIVIDTWESPFPHLTLKILLNVVLNFLFKKLLLGKYISHIFRVMKLWPIYREIYRN